MDILECAERVGILIKNMITTNSQRSNDNGLSNTNLKECRVLWSSVYAHMIRNQESLNIDNINSHHIYRIPMLTTRADTAFIHKNKYEEKKSI